MKKKLLWLIPVLIVIALALSVTLRQTTIQPEATPLSIEARQVGPQVIRQNPIAGQRLGLAQYIQIVFDRDMDQAKTGEAFSLLGPDRQPVAGQIAWPNARTFEFTPNAKLKPATVYKAVFSTQATASDGGSPREPIELQFKTTDQLAVGQVFPTADATDVDGATSITVIFNRPVVPVAIREEQSGLPQPLEFTPAIAGRGEWVSSSVYVYQPDQTLLSGIRYTVRVDAALKDVNGDSLGKSFVWQFETRAPFIQNYGLQNGPYNPGDNIENVVLDQPFITTFSQPMDQKSVAKNITLVNRETGKPQAVQLKWNKEFTELTIAPSGRYQIASFYKLDIAQDAQAKDGGALKEGLTLNFSTVPLPQIVNMSAGNTEKGFNDSFSIQFASPMDPESLKSRVIVTPAPKDGIQGYYNEYDRTYIVYGLQPGTDYIVRILPGMSDLYGNTIKNGSSFSFKTADLRPYANLVMPWTPLVYRAKGPQEVYFEYTNLDSTTVALYSLTFDEFILLLNADNSLYTANFKPRSGPVNEWSPNTQNTRNQLNRMLIKLEDPRGNALKPGYYLLGTKGKPLDYKTNFYQTSLFIVATDNITLKSTPTEGLAWITDLESGKPQADVKVTFYNDQLKQVGSATTDQNGVVYLDQVKSAVYARAEGTDRAAFTAINWGSGVWTGDFGIYENYYTPPSGQFAYLYTDRPVYRPGQDVYFKGIVRQNDDLRYSLPTEKKVYVRIQNPAGEDVFADYVSLSDLGSFNSSLKLSDDAALGSYNIFVSDAPPPTAPEKETNDTFGYLSFRVAEYRKPEFQVNAAAKSPNVLLGDKLDFSLDATYYSGGTVSNGTVNWFMESAPYYFEPKPKYSQFNFMDWDRDIYWSPNNSGYGGTLAQGQGVTDANGRFDLSQAVDFGKNKVSQQVTFNANVADVAGNVVSGQASVIVQQSQFYAGIRSTQYIGKQGEDQPFQIVVLDWDSNPAANQSATVRFVERRWYSVQEQDKQGQSRWVTSVKEISIAQKTVVTGKDGTAQISFIPPAGGVYKAIVTVKDSKGRSQQASAYIWVTSEKYVPWRQTNDRTFNLIADKDLYAPGDTAEILIAQPFQGEVYALVTYERGHIYKRDVVLLKGNSTVYKIPISADMAPNMYVSVTVISGGNNTKTPDFKIGMTRINIDTSQQTLDVKIAADKKSAGPGDNVTYTITTQDAGGKPVSADVSLAVVDKAALALAPANSAPILASFYSAQNLNVQTALGLVSNADDFNAQYRQSIPEGGGSGGGGGGDLGIITVRQDFKDTAAFRGQVTTDASGIAQVTVQLPENLTTWVADARAATTDSKVGQAAQELISTKPLFIELQTPRFFTAGDQTRLGATIHNNGQEPLNVQVRLDAQGVDLKSDAAQTVEVPAQQQAYVTWDVSVTPGASRVDLTATATSGSFSDASKPALGTLSNQGLPVFNFSATETVGTSGVLPLADSATESIQLPTTIAFSDAQLSIEVSPSLAASLQNGLTYLDDYPYLCMEQTISRFLPNVVTTRALKTANMPAVALQSNLDQQVNTALQKIYAKQLPDGGWNWWNGDKSDPNTSAYVVLGLLEAKESGYSVSASALDNGLSYLKNNLPNLQKNDDRSTYNRYAFMIYVLARGEELYASQTNYIYDQRTSLSLFGEAYLAQAIYILDPNDTRLNSLMSDLETAAVISASGAHWEESYNDYWNWNTDTRTTAIVLNALVQIDPQNDLAPKAVRWLMTQRTGGRWATTQETAWSLMALTNWMIASKEYDTNYQFAIGLNGDLLKQGQTSKDKLTETVKLQVEMKDLLKDTANYLVFTRGGGPGNLYYTAYLSATLPVESIQPLDQGMTLSRQYFALDDPKKPITEIQRGELVRVRLTMVLSESMHYVVIDDPLPAGLEAIDTTLATDTAVPTSYTIQDFDERGWGWWYFPNIELHDEKVTLSSDHLPAGTYVFTYLARASTAGTFKVIPPTASEFYFPDVGGRGAGSEFVVKP